MTLNDQRFVDSFSDRAGQVEHKIFHQIHDS
jgi:hypothetical protein